MACLKGVLVMSCCVPHEGRHSFISHTLTGRTLPFGRCVCGQMDYEEAAVMVANARQAELTDQRAVIAKAIADLDAEHRPRMVLGGDACGYCAVHWPCHPARVADDLRKAVEP